MLQDWISLFAPAAQERLTLLLNHVLSREAVATDRLKAHQGATLLIELKGWPSMVPSPPALALQITPAGLLERCAQAPNEPSLRLRFEAANPLSVALGLFNGNRPKVEIQGNAALATDMNWLIENLRWDLEDDLARVFGPMPAHELARMGAALAAGLAKMAQTVSTLSAGAGRSSAR